MQSMSIASMDKQSLTGRLHVQVKPASLYVFRSVSTDLHLRAACLDGAASKAKEGKTLKGSGWQHLRVHCRHTSALGGCVAWPRYRCPSRNITEG